MKDKDLEDKLIQLENQLYLSRKFEKCAGNDYIFITDVVKLLLEYLNLEIVLPASPSTKLQKKKK